MTDYHVVRTPLTFMGVEYTVSVHVPKSLDSEERLAYLHDVVKKKIQSHLFENHFTMNFYGINTFSV